MQKMIFILVNLFMMTLANPIIDASYLSTKSTLINNQPFPSEHYFKYNNNNYHSGLMIFYIVTISLSYAYLIFKLFYKESTKNFINRKNIRVIHSYYSGNIGTGIDLEKIFSNVELDENNILSIQFRECIRISSNSRFNPKIASPFFKCLQILLRIENSNIYVRLFGNGNFYATTKKLKIFNQIAKKLIAISHSNEIYENESNEPNEPNEFVQNNSFSLLQKSCIYHFQINKRPSFENLDELYTNSYVKRCDVNPLFTKLTFNFNDIRCANAKIHDNGNVYVVINTPTNNQKKYISEIHKIIMNNF
ncbi:putative ORFan [Tupanvirus deep ocean]|uniref:ORFan n=2 Tax=Tupanvirus TaxID=2094720 RepID=A0AC62A8Z0_9VIRU|nr:putative ORFan [Tupanvirus deep ocean]QKU34137.1 putative ORFan [Tupanvirus deep ocean]